MSKPTIKIHNVETDEIIEREMTDVEFQAWDAGNKASEQRKAEGEAKKSAAEAKLAALGLTADDLKALGLQE